eukprot:1151299-Pelagomonas_calceolata.AAC.3
MPKEPKGLGAQNDKSRAPAYTALKQHNTLAPPTFFCSHAHSSSPHLHGLVENTRPGITRLNMRILGRLWLHQGTPTHACRDAQSTNVY